MRIAITGGRGRLAPGLAAHLEAVGHEAVLFSRLSSGHLRDQRELVGPNGLASFAAVLHLGWSTVPLVAEQRPGIEQEQDIPFVQALVSASAGQSVKLVFFSTAAVYGNTTHEPATEESPCTPLGRYAAAKLGAERLLARHSNTCILRISNILDPGCAPIRPQGIIPVLVRAARDGSPATIWGDGSAAKDYLAAPDLHRAVAAVVARGECGVFNVASGHVVSVAELVALVETVTCRPIRTQHLPPYSWDVTSSRISSSKLRQATGWRPGCSLHDVVRSLADRFPHGDQCGPVPAAV